LSEEGEKIKAIRFGLAKDGWRRTKPQKITSLSVECKDQSPLNGDNTDDSKE